MQLETTVLEVKERSAYDLTEDRAMSESFRLVVAVTVAMSDWDIVQLRLILNES